MPFKLKLKKTRQYNVASKSLFVISVELLDGGVADCTLSVDSTGQECLDNVCQRQAINQPDFFGLRYINRSQQPRWVQLDRPLKLQLDKFASSHQLYLRVMYYVISGTSLITDEVTRYHYFLQLKNDLVEGRIICDCQQAVVLASYSRQAEYGNHDRERHTVEYLKNLLTFPKQMLDGGQIIDGSTLAETGRLEWLTAAVIQHHMSLHNMSQAQAEEGFITTCQQLRGYGQEMFMARDKRDQSEVTIAISLTGIRVLTDTSDTPHFYRWMDITNVINHKRTFSIECQKQGESVTFTLPSPEDGKYVWRMCVHQHTFYMKHQEALSVSIDEHRPKFQEHGLSESREELDVREVGSTSRLEPLTAAHRAHSTSCLELADHRPQPKNRALLPSYRPAPDYETAIQQKYQQQRAEAQLRYQNHHAHSQLLNTNAQPLVYGSHPDIHRIHYPDVTRHTVSVNQGVAATDDYAYGLKFVGNYPMAVNPNVQTDHALHYVNVYKPPPPYPSNGLASNSTPDLAVASQALNYHRGYINSHVSGSSPDLVSTRTALNRQYLGYVNPAGHNVVNYGRPNILPATHGTYNNLTSVLEPNPHIIIDPHHISDNIQKVYDERGNIMYSMPMRRISYQRHLVLPQQIKHNEAQEPIYENVPLPWQNEHGKLTMRERAQSLTTTDEIARLNERNGSHPTINKHGNVIPNINVTNYVTRIDNDSHYVNAQIIKGVRESSVPRESIPETDSMQNVSHELERVSLKDDKDYDETPYQSLSTHKLSNNNTISKSVDNVTSISVPDMRTGDTSADSALSSSIVNSTYSTSIELEGSKTNITKEKKRRRWGMFMGRGNKTVEVKSATLGRDRAKAGQPANKHRWSTGLPKFQPLPPSITKETLCQLLERKMSDEQLAFAFEQIPKGREGDAEYRTALLPQYAALNGFSVDNIPYEDNRVRLQPTPSNPHGYINASHVTMTVGSSQRFYVTVQASAAEHAAPVWECVWQVGARVLALVGADPPRYLPADGRPADYGQFQVSCGRWSRAAWGGSVRVRVRRATRTRTVWHVHYSAWPPHAHAPADLGGFLDFLSEVNGLGEAEAAAGGALAAAPLALCGARAGPALAAHLLLHVLDTNQVRPPRARAPAAARARHQPGTTPPGPRTCCCTCSTPTRYDPPGPAHLLLHVLDTNQELDIPRTIGLLHQQRANLIENVHQYKFLHQILLQYLKQSRLI
ncbi:tyrosine-protein phosphatase non-receptor type 14 isoform X4 [Nymphalis io]|uniref:tyrosine-protein phosphatase non-receptor type 14 isoform X4 n=1 Tax=Inachis io TaxID=171585 RepID=UPI00216870F9|nr:tyrosine-protein phosphatase non-receptor type 14 isoform X4 [Nymphalis io]